MRRILSELSRFFLELMFTILAPFVLMFSGGFMAFASLRYQIEWLFTAGLVTAVLGAMLFAGIFLRNFFD